MDRILNARFAFGGAHGRANHFNAAKLRIALFDSIMRVLILWFLDLLLNGTIECLALHAVVPYALPGLGDNVQMTSNDTAKEMVYNVTQTESINPFHGLSSSQVVYLALFAPERFNSAIMWRILPLRMYLAAYFVYYSVLLVGMLFLYSHTAHLVALYTWAFPLSLLLLATTINSFLVARLSSVLASLTSWGDAILFVNNSLSWATKIQSILHFGVSLISFIAIFAIYCRLRRASFLNLNSPIIAYAPLFTPLLECILFPVIPFEVRGRVFWFTFAPIFMQEVTFSLRLLGLGWTEIQNMYRQLKLKCSHFGVRFAFMENISRINVSRIFRIYWITKLAFHGTYLLCRQEEDSDIMSHRLPGSTWSAEVTSIVPPVTPLTNNSVVKGFGFGLGLVPTQLPGWIDTDVFMEVGIGIEYLLVRSCETVIALIGTSGAVANIGQLIYSTFSFLLDESGAPGLGEDGDEQAGAGSVIGILFFILAMQSGLSGLRVEKRLSRLYRNLWLIFSALLHLVHHLVHSALMKLSAASMVNRFRLLPHVRVCLVSLAVITIPLWFVYQVSCNSTSVASWFSPWIISVMVFGLEVVVKVGTSLATYVCMVVGSRTSNEVISERTDDIVFLAKSVGAVIEFLFGFILLLTGVWILLYDYGGVIRAVMIGLHAYCNVWLQARNGWEVFCRRRTANRRIDSLATTSGRSLEEYNDVCAICYQNMTRYAKVTNCGHYFHGSCLRKWLYIQDTCPLCHRKVFEGDSPTVPAANDAEQDDNGIAEIPDIVLDNGVHGQNDDADSSAGDSSDYE